MKMQLSNQNILPTLMIVALTISTIFIFATPQYYLAFIPCLLFILTIILFKIPEFGAYLLIFMIPFGAFRKFEIGGIGININWILAGTLFTLMIFLYLIRKTSIKHLMFPLLPWFILFFLFNIISTWLSPFMAVALADLKLSFASFLYIMLFTMLITQKGFFHTLPSVLILSVFISSFLGNLGFFFDIELFTREQSSGIFVRNLGGAIDANNLSLMVIACLPLVIHRYFYSKLNWSKFIYGCVIINSILAISTSYSRGGLIIFFISVIFILIEFRQHFKAKYFGFILAGISVGLTIFVTIMPDSFWERHTGGWQDSSITRRTAYLSVAYDAFLQRPFLGSGPDSFYSIFSQTSLAKLDKKTGKPLGRYAHNTYIEILVGTGILGLLIFLIILIKSLLMLSKIKQEYEDAHQIDIAHYIGSCRLFLIIVLIYLLLFSESHHKFLLLGIVMSQLAYKYCAPVNSSAEKGELTHE